MARKKVSITEMRPIHQLVWKAWCSTRMQPRPERAVPTRNQVPGTSIFASGSCSALSLRPWKISVMPPKARMTVLHCRANMNRPDVTIREAPPQVLHCTMAR